MEFLELIHEGESKSQEKQVTYIFPNWHSFWMAKVGTRIGFSYFAFALLTQWYTC